MFTEILHQIVLRIELLRLLHTLPEWLSHLIKFS